MNLANKKAAKSMDIPTKLVKVSGCLFSRFIASNVMHKLRGLCECF